METAEVYNKIRAVIPDDERANYLTKYLCNNIVTNIKNVTSMELRFNYDCHVIYNNKWIKAASTIKVDYTIEGGYKYDITLNI
jgi:hypothetical protein